MKMIKVKVANVDNYFYTLEDKDHKTYTINIEFYETKIDVGDIIYIDEKVLKEPNLYAYGPLLEEASVEDLVKITKNGKDIYLQRYYG